MMKQDPLAMVAPFFLCLARIGKLHRALIPRYGCGPLPSEERKKIEREIKQVEGQAREIINGLNP